MPDAEFPQHLTDESQRRIAAGLDPIPDLPEYDVLRGFEAVRRSTCATCGIVCVDVGWEGEAHWSHAVGGRPYMHEATPMEITPGRLPQPTRESQWWNRAGLHTYTHPTEEVEDMGHPHLCLRRPDGQWFTLRHEAPAMFLDLWDDGLGEPVIPCPGDHIDVALYGAGITMEGFRLADAVEVRREDLVQKPDLLSMIYADMRRPGSVDWAALDREDPPPAPGTFANAESMRDAMYAALTAQYEPTGLILGPEDYRHVDAADRVARVPADDPYRRANQQRIAEAFGIPGWMLGVEGAKPPVKVRARSLVRRLPRRVLTTIPGVTYWGPRQTGEGWMNAEPAEPRAWRFGVHVGNYRVGTTPHDPWTCGDDECTEAHP